MSLYINKVFNVCEAWERLQEEFSNELNEIQEALCSFNVDHDSSSVNDTRDKVLDSLNKLGWETKTFSYLGIKSPAYWRTFDAENAKVTFKAEKKKIGVDIFNSLVSSLDSWVTYRAKNHSKGGGIAVLIMPTAHNEKITHCRVSFEYMVDRIRFLDIAEGNSFAILGVSTENASTEVIDADTVIRRTITFESHQIQAGVGLLSYFSEVLKQKCSEVNSQVSIEQDGDKVRLMIKTEAGMEHKVEALLNEYGEVLNGTLPAAQFMSDQVHLLSLQRKLDMAALEVKHQQDILALTKENYTQRIVTLEEQVSGLRQILSDSITSHRNAQEQVSKLIDKYGSNSEVELELLSMAKKLDERAADVHKEELERIIKQLHEENPRMASEFLFMLKGPLEGVVGNIIYSWLPHLGSIIGLAIR
ncbi:hypothetical protein BA894_01330 [Vibrio natriegens]|uniref:hypothetical protein n=1 Tax=Vibrio natriegens TaxID=691 RepID=UPI0008040511|nr:hypothetical protein [Vibrio natriegens]ANQ25172.1 hypothetical protein BA894_01330 [Vibrio natriegens]